MRDPILTGRGGAAPRRPTAGPAELKPGQTRKDVEGVFVVRDGHAVFAPVKTGIAGEKYFEVLDGLKKATRSSPGRSSRARR